MITIDPNLRGCGVATWHKETLFSANYVKNLIPTGRGYEVFCAAATAVGSHIHLKSVWVCGPVVIEMPRAYGSVHTKGDPNDLLDVMGVGAACALALRNFGPIQSVAPSDWKGNVKKSIMLERIWSKLSEEERAVVQKTNKSDREDVLDAIGIGLHKLGRLNTRVFNNGE